jgi:hypothetical protein
MVNRSRTGNSNARATPKEQDCHRKSSLQPRSEAARVAGFSRYGAAPTFNHLSDCLRLLWRNITSRVAPSGMLGER